MRNHRNSLRPAATFRIGQLTTLLEVHHRVGVEVVDHAPVSSVGKGEGSTGMGIVVAPALTAYTTSSKIVHAFLHALVTKVVVRAEGIDLIRGYLPEVLNELGHLVNAAPQFVTQSKHPEGGMMAIGAQDILALLVEELHKHRVLVIETAPEGKLWLQDDTQFVGSYESSLRRTPRMETYMVQTIGSTIAQVATPRLHIHRHMTCQWPDTGIVLATQEDGMTVGIEVLAFNVEVFKYWVYS